MEEPSSGSVEIKPGLVALHKDVHLNKLNKIATPKNYNFNQKCKFQKVWRNLKEYVS